MKSTITKLLLFAVITVFAVSVNAQTQKGNAMIGSSISSLNVGLKSGSNTTFTLNPKAGIFIKDGLLVGMDALFGIQHMGGTKANAVDYGIGGFGRYYVTDKNVEFVRHGKFFFEANLGFQGQNVSKGGDKTNGLGFGFGPGFAYFINQNIALETMVKYQGIVGFGDTAYQNNLVWSLGFQIYLPCKGTKNKVVSDFK